jgi:hypothetical protein
MTKLKPKTKAKKKPKKKMERLRRWDCWYVEDKNAGFAHGTAQFGAIGIADVFSIEQGDPGEWRLQIYSKPATILTIKYEQTKGYVITKNVGDIPNAKP